MKTLTTTEKLSLIRHHGEHLARIGTGVYSPRKSEILESCQRMTELIKSIPKIELGIED